jgi:hypothetical protein
MLVKVKPLLHVSDAILKGTPKYSTYPLVVGFNVAPNVPDQGHVCLRDPLAIQDYLVGWCPPNFTQLPFERCNGIIGKRSQLDGVVGHQPLDYEVNAVPAARWNCARKEYRRRKATSVHGRVQLKNSALEYKTLQTRQESQGNDDGVGVAPAHPRARARVLPASASTPGLGRAPKPGP